MKSQVVFGLMEPRAASVRCFVYHEGGNRLTRVPGVTARGSIAASYYTSGRSMFWKRWRQGGADAGAVARAVHSRWLTAALASGREYPRIPLRRVDQGGFSAMMRRPGGPDRAAQWWDAALARVDDLAEE